MRFEPIQLEPRLGLLEQKKMQFPCIPVLAFLVLAYFVHYNLNNLVLDILVLDNLDMHTTATCKPWFPKNSWFIP